MANATELDSAALDLEHLHTALQGARHLVLFGKVMADDIGQGLLRLLETLCASPQERHESPLAAYHRLFALLTEEAELYPEPLVGDAWQNHLLDRLLVDENAFSRKAQLASTADMGTALRQAARLDLERLHTLFHLPASGLLKLVAGAITRGNGDLAPDAYLAWDGLQPLERGPARHGAEGRHFKQTLAQAGDWGALLDDLAGYYARAGAGIFGRFRAFRWVRRGGSGQLEGVAAPDPIRLEELIGYEEERALLLRNTEQFLAGFPANNVLLYGDRGTGKSSTVKALLNRYAEQGLRLIEVSRQHLSDFPQILALLRERRERFFEIFIDDLSFDEQEVDYKDLKAMLEGSLEARPDNVLLYATSNRRHLVQERFRDRGQPGDDEIHSQDTAQEKLSLSDRFGITIIFLAPNQDQYLEIVYGLVRQRGLAVDHEQLRARALRWTVLHNARSGRTARQFVDYLVGELGLEQRSSER